MLLRPERKLSFPYHKICMFIACRLHRFTENQGLPTESLSAKSVFLQQQFAIFTHKSILVVGGLGKSNKSTMPN